MKLIIDKNMTVNQLASALEAIAEALADVNLRVEFVERGVGVIKPADEGETLQ
jgi:hypothetical protein